MHRPHHVDIIGFTTIGAIYALVIAVGFAAAWWVGLVFLTACVFIILAVAFNLFES
jgi:hypothetical protein